MSLQYKIIFEIEILKEIKSRIFIHFTFTINHSCEPNPEFLLKYNFYINLIITPAIELLVLWDTKFLQFSQLIFDYPFWILQLRISLLFHNCSMIWHNLNIFYLYLNFKSLNKLWLFLAWFNVSLIKRSNNSK